MSQSKILRIETLSPAAVHWSPDGCNEVHDASTKDSGLGLHYIELPTGSFVEGTSVVFIFYWHDAGRWEGKDCEVRIE